MSVKNEMPSILIAGGSGLIGTYLTRYLKDRGFRVYKLTRKATKRGQVFWNPDTKKISASKLAKIDVLINLAGENIGSSRWTSSRKRKIINSRVQSTEFLFESLVHMPRLKYYIGASGINCYDPAKKLSAGGGQPYFFTEEDPFGNDFLAEVVLQWERAHHQILDRVPGSIFRIAMVLSKAGGALPAMKRPIALGLGAPIGTGRQMQPWIHIEDLSRMICYAIDEQLSGTYNAVANNDSNFDFTKKIARRLKRPIWLPNVPKKIIKILLGERAVLLLNSMRASNEKIIAAGFEFKYAKLENALRTFFKRN